MSLEKNTTLKIFTDGGSRGNPGPAASAFVVLNEEGSTLYHQGKFLGTATNNFAEYSAVILALDWLSSATDVTNTTTTVSFFLDSLLVVKQLMGEYKIKSPDILPLVLKVKDLEKKLNLTFTYNHVPREQNTEADALVNQTLDLSKI